MADTQETRGAAAEREAPPADVFMLVGLFVNQAYMGLGAMRDPKTEAPIVDLAYAKHAIDMLELLHRKMQGNLTAPEKNYLENMLYQLRMTFVRVKEHPPASERESAEEPSEPPTEEASGETQEPEQSGADPESKEAGDA